MNECKSTHSSKLTKPSQVAAIGFIFASAIFVGLASEAQARIIWRYGDVRCHAAAAGPQYYYSRIESLSFGIDDPEGLLKLRNNTDEARRLERRTLDRLTGEFARYVAEYHEIDALTLLFPHCEVTKPGAAAAAARIEEATYFRDGAFVFYETSEKIAVDWVPDFSHAFAASSQAAVNAAADRKALAVGSECIFPHWGLVEPDERRGSRGRGPRAPWLRSNDGVGCQPRETRAGVARFRDAQYRGRHSPGFLRRSWTGSRRFTLCRAGGRPAGAPCGRAGGNHECGHGVVPGDGGGADARIAIFDTCWFNPFRSYPIVTTIRSDRNVGAHRVGSQPVTSADGGLLVAYAAAAPGTCLGGRSFWREQPIHTGVVGAAGGIQASRVSVMFRRVTEPPCWRPPMDDSDQLCIRRSRATCT